MRTWEYRIVGFDKFGIRNTTVFDSDEPDGLRKIQNQGSSRPSVALALARELNAIGAEGWELVARDRPDEHGTVWFFFKRAIIDANTQ